MRHWSGIRIIIPLVITSFQTELISNSDMVFFEQ